jgi:hypothetical protein
MDCYETVILVNSMLDIEDDVSIPCSEIRPPVSMAPPEGVQVHGVAALSSSGSVTANPESVSGAQGPASLPETPAPGQEPRQAQGGPQGPEVPGVLEILEAPEAPETPDNQ